MPDVLSDTALLVEAAEAGGEIALRHFRTDVETWDKGDDSPVTVADLEINEMLSGQLGGARPDYGWLSEESEDCGTRLDRDRVFIIDPIDGTRAFIAGEKGFGVALAVVEQGVVTSAVMHMPARGETFSAARGHGAWKNGEPLRASAQEEIAEATVLTASWQMRAENWPGGVPPLTRHFRSSLVWRFCLVAEARFDTMLTFRRAYEWDVAAGALIAAEAGAHVTDSHGQAMRFNSAEGLQAGVIAAPPPLHAQIMAHRTAVGARD